MHKVFSKSQIYTQALLESLRSAPLLVDDLPEAVCFDRSKFFSAVKVEPTLPVPELNFSQKLGHLYEDALAHVLSSASDLDLLGQSVQIFDDNKITIGELDFILKDEHQLQLVKLDYTKRCLLEKYGVDEVVTKHLIYGKLFDHYKADQKPCPPSMRADCQREVWMYLREWEAEFEVNHVKVVPKCLWPVSVENLIENLDVVTREEFVEEATQRCTMIWDERSQATQFVTPNTWTKS